MFEYLEIFHNRRRRHSALGMLTPCRGDGAHAHVHVALSEKRKAQLDAKARSGGRSKNGDERSSKRADIDRQRAGVFT